MKAIYFEISKDRKEIEEDYYRAVLNLDEKFQSGQITPETHEEGHKYAWQTMLRRHKFLAETYRI